MLFPMYGGYGLYLLFTLPALLLGFWAQLKVQGAFKKYSQKRTVVGLSGAETARRMLDAAGLNNVRIEETGGVLSDHYDPASKVLRLSHETYRGISISAAGVAAHEAGHALQDSQGYFPLYVRSAIVPAVQIGSWLGPIIFMLGLFLSSSLGTQIAWFGILVFSATAIFAVVTLPVEFDATRRAKAWLSSSGVLYQNEMEGIHKVLDAAALTYVAAAIQAISTVLYYAFLLSGRSRRD
ncbi:MAG: zinc metallopeptidase [Anaerolineae bacterium]|nr:zinc metallopeptidase [Anaerolineae bacterium]